MVDHDDMLQFLLQTAQMGRGSTLHLLRKIPSTSSIYRLLVQQAKEYQKILQRAKRQLYARRQSPKSVRPIKLQMIWLATDMKLLRDRRDTHIAQMMIQGSVMGILETIKRIHQYDGSQQQILQLAQDTLDMQKRQIRQLEEFVV